MNLMINDYCNLDCSYCFAKKVFSNDRKNISKENFDYFIKFLKQSNYPFLRLLGGEPTLHPDFVNMVKYANNDIFFKEILVFSNGLNLTPELIEEISSNKINFLINFNSKEDIGEDNYNKTIKNIEYLVEHCRSKNYLPKVCLGINIYDPNFDYQYIIDFTKRLEINKIRYSIVVPKLLGEKISLSHYKQFIPQLLNFLDECYKNGIKCNLDCNNIPKCLFTKDELITMLMQGHDLCDKSNNNCTMPLDVDSELNCTRCFPFFEKYKVNIKHFNRISEVQSYFKDYIDTKRFEVPTFQECESCKWFIEKNCQGGCLTYKFK